MRIQELLAVATARGASDPHLSAGLPPLLRVDGAIQSLGGPPVNSEQVRGWIASVGGAWTAHRGTRTSAPKCRMWAAFA